MSEASGVGDACELRPIGELMASLNITRRQLIAGAGVLSPHFAAGRASAAPLQNASLTSRSESKGGPYARSAAEVSAGILPVDHAFPPGNVLRYGAIGDGHADDTTAVSSALEVCRFGGCLPVVLPSGHTFKICRYIQVHSNTVIYLWGTLLLTERNAGLFANGASEIAIYGFKTGCITDASVVNDYVWNPGKGNISPAVHIRSCTNVLLDGINVLYVSQGIFISNASQNCVTNSAFSPVQAYPVNVRVVDCSTTFCEWSGIANLSSYDSGFYNNYVYRCGDSGLWMMGAVDGEIIGNHRISPQSTAPDCARHGYNIRAYPTTWNDVQGISLQGCLNVLVSGNVVKNFWGQGIDVKDACNRVVISGNRVDNCENASIIVREGDSGNTAACHKVSILGNTISGHGTLQFNLPNPAAGAIHASSCFAVEISNNVVYSYQRTPAINCLGPGRYNAGMYLRSPQQSTLSICGNSIEFKSAAFEGDFAEFSFTSSTPGAIVINGEYTSVKCDGNRVITDRYYYADQRYNASPAIMLTYVIANGSFYPSSASLNGNEVTGWGSTAIQVNGASSMPFSGLLVNNNNISTPGRHGIQLLSTNFATCMGNSISQPNCASDHYQALCISGEEGKPVTGINCIGNALIGPWDVGGNGMDYCLSVSYASDINLSNNQFAGASVGNISATHISGNLFLEGSTGFPRSGNGSPNGTVTGYYAGEKYFDRLNAKWWIATSYQSKTWTQFGG